MMKPASATRQAIKNCLRAAASATGKSNVSCQLFMDCPFDSVISALAFWNSLPLVPSKSKHFEWICRLKIKSQVSVIMRHSVMCNLFQTK